MIEKVWFEGGQGSFMAHDFAYPNVSPSLIHLAIFLADELRLGDDVSWILNEEIIQRSGNATYIEKENNNIILTYEYLEEVPPFKINKQLFLKLVNSWLKIYPTFPDRIDLTQEDNKFTFEFDTKDGHQKIVIE